MIWLQNSHSPFLSFAYAVTRGPSPAPHSPVLWLFSGYSIFKWTPEISLIHWLFQHFVVLEYSPSLRSLFHSKTKNIEEFTPFVKRKYKHFQCRSNYLLSSIYLFESKIELYEQVESTLIHDIEITNTLRTYQTYADSCSFFYSLPRSRIVKIRSIIYSENMKKALNYVITLETLRTNYVRCQCTIRILKNMKKLYSGVYKGRSESLYEISARLGRSQYRVNVVVEKHSVWQRVVYQCDQHRRLLCLIAKHYLTAHTAITLYHRGIIRVSYAQFCVKNTRTNLDGEA